jgi:D-glycero-D-manno-heptose 1,7-bisphosphate phosphatase
MVKALFLDRDGVLIDYIPYLSRPDQVTLPEGAAHALLQWQTAGYLLIVVTNQSGIGRGLFTVADMQAVHQCMEEKYAQQGVRFTEILVCPHHPTEGCTCRKPSPEMLLQAAKRYGIDLSRSVLIGDNLSDLECAQNAGCQPVLVLTGLGETTKQNLPSYYETILICNHLMDTTQLLTTSRRCV